MNKSVILITGASAGLGQACANGLASAGWTVIGASRRGTSSGSWRGVVVDVDSDDSVTNTFADVDTEHGQLNAVLACAGWGVASAVEQTSIEDAKAQLETNFWGVIRVVNAALPRLRAQGGGHIVILSSIGGVLGIPFQAFYSASKFALEGLAEGLAYEVEPFGIHVTLVQPGNIATDFTASRQRAAAAAGDPVYAAALAKAVGVMERDEANGAPAGDVAAVVQRVLDSRRPPRRVSVGKPGERFGLVARRFLPFRLFEAGAKGSLGVGLRARPGPAPPVRARPGRGGSRGTRPGPRPGQGPGPGPAPCPCPSSRRRCSRRRRRAGPAAGRAPA